MTIFEKNFNVSDINRKMNNGRFIKVECEDAGDGNDDILVEGAPYIVDTRSLMLGGKDGITTVLVYKIELETKSEGGLTDAVVIGKLVGELSVDRFVDCKNQPQYILDLDDLM